MEPQDSQPTQDQRDALTEAYKRVQSGQHSYSDDQVGAIKELATRWGIGQTSPDISPTLLESRQAASKSEFEQNLPPSTIGSRIAAAGEQASSDISSAGHSLYNMVKAGVTGNAGELMNMAASIPKSLHDSLVEPASKYVEAMKNADYDEASKQAMSFLTQTVPTVGAAESVVKTGVNAIPSTTRSAANLDKAMSAAKNVPIDTTALQSIVNRAKELKATGSSMPKVIADLNRELKSSNLVVNPNTGTITTQTGVIPYSQGRDFATSAGRLSELERAKVNAPMHRQVSKLADAFKTANRDAAVKAGVEDLYDKGINEYRRAMKIYDTLNGMKEIANSKIGQAIGVGLGGGLALYIARKTLGLGD